MTMDSEISSIVLSINPDASINPSAMTLLKKIYRYLSRTKAPFQELLVEVIEGGDDHGKASKAGTTGRSDKITRQSILDAIPRLGKSVLSRSLYDNFVRRPAIYKQKMRVLVSHRNSDVDLPVEQITRIFRDLDWKGDVFANTAYESASAATAAAPASAPAAAFNVGQDVLSLYDNIWYPAIVIRREGSNKYDLLWPDNTISKGVGSRFITRSD